MAQGLVSAFHARANNSTGEKEIFDYLKGVNGTLNGKYKKFFRDFTDALKIADKEAREKGPVSQDLKEEQMAQQQAAKEAKWRLLVAYLNLLLLEI